MCWSDARRRRVRSHALRGRQRARHAQAVRCGSARECAAHRAGQQRQGLRRVDDAGQAVSRRRPRLRRATPTRTARPKPSACCGAHAPESALEGVVLRLPLTYGAGVKGNFLTLTGGDCRGADAAAGGHRQSPQPAQRRQRGERDRRRAERARARRVRRCRSPTVKASRPRHWRSGSAKRSASPRACIACLRCCCAPAPRSRAGGPSRRVCSIRWKSTRSGSAISLDGRSRSRWTRASPRPRRGGSFATLLVGGRRIRRRKANPTLPL